jgi:hypothetical protein
MYWASPVYSCSETVASGGIAIVEDHIKLSLVSLTQQHDSCFLQWLTELFHSMFV